MPLHVIDSASMKWEYMHLHHPALDEALEPSVEILNVMGEMGWELVSVVLDGGNWFVYFLKRPLS